MTVSIYLSICIMCYITAMLVGSAFVCVCIIIVQKTAARVALYCIIFRKHLDVLEIENTATFVNASMYIVHRY